MKNRYKGGMPKKGRGLGQFADLRVGLDKKEGVVFLKGDDNPMHTMVKKLNLWGNSAVDESAWINVYPPVFLENRQTEGTKNLVGKSCCQKPKRFHLWGIYIQISKVTVPVPHNTKVDSLLLRPLTGQIL